MGSAVHFDAFPRAPSLAQRTPMLELELSAVFLTRALFRYRKQWLRWHMKLPPFFTRCALPAGPGSIVRKYRNRGQFLDNPRTGKKELKTAECRPFGGAGV